MPFSGRNPGDRRSFVHSGDSGQGITNGVAGALTIAPLVADAPARYADLFDPGRKPFTARPSLANFIEGQVGAVKNFAEYATPGEIASENELEPGRSEEHTSELQSLMRISYAVFCLKKKKQKTK